MPKIVKWIAAGAVAALIAVTAGTYLYIHFIEDDAPAPLALSDTASTGQSSTSTEGINTWQATAASQVGYRVKEVLFGQNTEAVGRTNSVTGTLNIDDKTVKTVDLSVDLTSVSSDQSRRDNQFRGRIMETDKYPTANYRLTQPITLNELPNTSAQTVATTGELTLHGVTKTVATNLNVMRDGSNVKVQGSIPITFADYDIENPSFGGITTEDNGILELLIVFEPKA